MLARRADLLIIVVLGAMLVWGGEALMQTLIDLTELPLGDGKVSGGPVAGSIWSCTTSFGRGGAFQNGPWIHCDGTFALIGDQRLQTCRCQSNRLGLTGWHYRDPVRSDLLEPVASAIGSVVELSELA